MRSIAMEPERPGMTSFPMRRCKAPVRLFVWDSLVCAAHAEERLVELLEAALRSAGVEPDREVPAA